MFIFGVFLVRIFPHSEWIPRDTEYLSVFSPNARNTDQKNSEYWHFSRSETFSESQIIVKYILANISLKLSITKQVYVLNMVVSVFIVNNKDIWRLYSISFCCLYFLIWTHKAHWFSAYIFQTLNMCLLAEVASISFQFNIFTVKLNILKCSVIFKVKSRNTECMSCSKWVIKTQQDIFFILLLIKETRIS